MGLLWLWCVHGSGDGYGVCMGVVRLLWLRCVLSLDMRLEYLGWFPWNCAKAASDDDFEVMKSEV